jgi:predicted GNAT family acetyltransferase
VTVRDNTHASRFEIDVDGEIAYLEYERRPGAVALIHTVVPPALQGRGLANELAKGALDAVRAEGSRVIAICPVVRAYMRKHRS